MKITASILLVAFVILVSFFLLSAREETPKVYRPSYSDEIKCEVPADTYQVSVINRSNNTSGPAAPSYIPQ